MHQIDKIDFRNDISILLLIIVFIGVLSTTLFYYEAILAGFGMTFLKAFEAQKFRWILWVVALLPLISISKKVLIDHRNWIRPIIVGFIIVAMMVTISLVFLNIFVFRIQGMGITAAQFLGNIRVLFVSEFFFLLVTNIIISIILASPQFKINTSPIRPNNSVSENPSLELKSGLDNQIIPIDMIQNISGYDYYVKVHTASQTYVLRKSLKMLETQLKGHDFFRIHRSSLINFSKVDKLIAGKISYVKMKNGEKIKVSRRRLKSVAAKFYEYKNSIDSETQ